MFGFRLRTSLLFAAACLLYTAGFLMADGSTKRALTCDDAHNVHHLSCDGGVIRVQTALYGRADKQTCSYGRPLHQLANTHCALQGTVETIRRSCDGKSVCELNTNPFRRSDPCHGIYKYLETTYTCEPALRVVACEHSVANLQCDEGQEIFVYGADYGRRDQTTCIHGRPPSQINNIYCSHPTDTVAASCNGKNSCAVRASNSVFGDPCHGIYKYLEVTYRCRCKESKV